MPNLYKGEGFIMHLSVFEIVFTIIFLLCFIVGGVGTLVLKKIRKKISLNENKEDNDIILKPLTNKQADILLEDMAKEIIKEEDYKDEDTESENDYIVY